MTALLNLYEDFGSDQPAMDAKRLEAELDALEEEKLSSFEAGYKSGWDDAVDAQQKLEKTVSSELAANLQDAAFQYHEMRVQMLRSVEELMQALVTTILPASARAGLGRHICDLVQSRAQNDLEGQIELAVHPEALPSVEATLEHVLDRYSLVADPALSPVQAHVKFRSAEERIDLGEVISEIDAAITDFFEVQRKEPGHE